MAERKTGLLSRLSLRWRLLLLISGAALLILMLAVQATSRQAKHEIQELMDGQMRMVAQLALHSARVALSSQPSSQPFGAHNIEAGPGKDVSDRGFSDDGETITHVANIVFVVGGLHIIEVAGDPLGDGRAHVGHGEAQLRERAEPGQVRQRHAPRAPAVRECAGARQINKRTASHL